LVLELLAYSHRALRAGPIRVMDQLGLTRSRRCPGDGGELRGSSARRHRFRPVSDDSRSGWAAAGTARGLVAQGLAATP
jgi:hypothetical protein